MRRLLAAAVMGAGLFATACSGSGGDGAATTTAASSSAGTPAAGAGGPTDNTEQVCADADKAIKAAGEKFDRELDKAFGGEPDTRSDAEALNSVRTVFTEWAAGVREHADRATDADLKAALSTYADEIGKLATVITSADDLADPDVDLDSPAVKTAADMMDAICG
jgi:hypothetical protein